ncbi:MAG: hypothetical protein GXC94_06270 [Comamonadaceae bacterium]|nr:hypothetical protein [Comamonadaceae bacterium]
MTLQIDETPTPLTAEQILTGWRREFCVELLGDGQARVFLRAVEQPSLKATELRRGLLFHRVSSAFGDLKGCVDAAAEALERLARSAVKQRPEPENLFANLSYDRTAWEQAVDTIEAWQRRPRAAAAGR